MLDPLQYYFQVLCNGMKTRFRMVMIAHPGPGIGFNQLFMWRIIILPTPVHHTDLTFNPPDSHPIPPSRHPNTSPWGCYVHCWNGCGGPCLSTILGTCGMHSGCTPVIKCMLSPAEQACTPFHHLLSP